MSLIQKFSNNVSNVVRPAIDAATTYAENLKNEIQGFTGTAASAIQKGTTFVGLNQAGVSSITGAIEIYVSDLQKIADSLNDRADITDAIRGEETEQAVKEYLSAVKTAVDAYCSALIAYANQMDKYAKAYMGNDTTLSSDISGEAKSLQSSAEAATVTRESE